MEAIAAAEERIVSERLKQKLNEVNTAAQSQLAGIQDHVQFTLQQAYYRCAYECFDRRRNQEDIRRCVEHCSVPTHNAQNIFQNEMARFQGSFVNGLSTFRGRGKVFVHSTLLRFHLVGSHWERLNRSLMVCQDKHESARIQKNRNATMELESCVDQSVQDSINELPHLVAKIEGSLGINH
ncbi:putative acyl-[acyl-carrier-protein] desaturase, chloroplastic-like [Capsicum annuum]|nr:putative acyl-[acyl-carrier-protein] desaturase, chloroplastic-like [Capsicum annuum]